MESMSRVTKMIECRGDVSPNIRRCVVNAFPYQYEAGRSKDERFPSSTGVSNSVGKVHRHVHVVGSKWGMWKLVL
jgi:hypothetical protein